MFGTGVLKQLSHKALTTRRPAVNVTHGVCKTWWSKYRGPQDGAAIASAQALDDQYGDICRGLVAEHSTAYKLCYVLRGRDPPIDISDGIAKQWIQKFSGIGLAKYVDNAGHLESQYGNCVRAHPLSEGFSAATLASWLLLEQRVSAPMPVCQKWLYTDWSSSGALLHPDSVEEALGERLRLQQYCSEFAEDHAAKRL